MTPFVFATPPPARDALRLAISALTLADETALVNRLLSLAALPDEHASLVVRQAAGWVERVRTLKREQYADQASALTALEVARDAQLKRGFQLMFAQGAEAPR